MMASPSNSVDALRLTRQLSLASEPESERILAVGGIKQPKRHIPSLRDPPDLEPEEQENRIRHQLETIRNKLRALLQVCASGLSAQPPQTRNSKEGPKLHDYQVGEGISDVKFWLPGQQEPK